MSIPFDPERQPGQGKAVKMNTEWLIAFATVLVLLIAGVLIFVSKPVVSCDTLFGESDSHRFLVNALRAETTRTGIHGIPGLKQEKKDLQRLIKEQTMIEVQLASRQKECGPLVR